MNTELSLKLFVVLSRTFATVSEVVKQDIKTYGLSLSEFGTLELLYHKGQQRIQDIGKKILLTSGSMTYVVDQLVKKGLVFRNTCKEDKRITYIELSEKGTCLLKDIFPQHECCITELFSTLSKEEIVQLTENLKQISKSITKKED